MIDLAFSNTETAILDGLDRVLADSTTPGWTVSESGECALDEGLWGRLLDLTPIEGGDDGGKEVSFLSLALMAERLGGALVGLPLIDHVVAIRLLRASERGARLAADAVAGRHLLALASTPDQALAVRTEFSMTAAIAQRVVRITRERAVEIADASERRLSANLGDFPLAPPPAASWTTVGGPGSAPAGMALAERKVLISAALGGMVRKALELAVDYAKVREQFGAPIGSFQSIAHGLATVQVQADSIEILARHAAWARDDEPRLFDYRARMAYGFAAINAAEATKTAMHVFGGYGATWDYPIQAYFRTSKALSLIVGDPVWDQRAVGRQLLESGGDVITPQLHTV